MPREYIYGIGYNQFEEHTNNCPKNGTHEWVGCKNPMDTIYGEDDGRVQQRYIIMHYYRCKHCGAFLEIDSGD